MFISSLLPSAEHHLAVGNQSQSKSAGEPGLGDRGMRRFWQRDQLCMWIKTTQKKCQPSPSERVSPVLTSHLKAASQFSHPLILSVFASLQDVRRASQSHRLGVSFPPTVTGLLLRILQRFWTWFRSGEWGRDNFHTFRAPNGAGQLSPRVSGPLLLEPWLGGVKQEVHVWLWALEEPAILQFYASIMDFEEPWGSIPICRSFLCMWSYACLRNSLEFHWIHSSLSQKCSYWLQHKTPSMMDPPSHLTSQVRYNTGPYFPNQLELTSNGLNLRRVPKWLLSADSSSVCLPTAAPLREGNRQIWNFFGSIKPTKALIFS